MEGVGTIAFGDGKLAIRTVEDGQFHIFDANLRDTGEIVIPSDCTMIGNFYDNAGWGFAPYFVYTTSDDQMGIMDRAFQALTEPGSEYPVSLFGDGRWFLMEDYDNYGSMRILDRDLDFREVYRHDGHVWFYNDVFRAVRLEEGLLRLEYSDGTEIIPEYPGNAEVTTAEDGSGTFLAVSVECNADASEYRSLLLDMEGNIVVDCTCDSRTVITPITSDRYILSDFMNGEAKLIDRDGRTVIDAGAYLSLSPASRLIWNSDEMFPQKEYHSDLIIGTRQISPQKAGEELWDSGINDKRRDLLDSDGNVLISAASGIRVFEDGLMEVVIGFRHGLITADGTWVYQESIFGNLQD